MSERSDSAVLALPGARIFGRRAGDAEGVFRGRGEGSLLAATYRAADGWFFWLLAAHLPLIAGLSLMRGTWLAALAFGVPVIAAAMAAARLARGTFFARCAVATSLLLLSALIIHQSGGMIEMHFHIFAILSFLLMYRDWRVPVVGAAVVAVYHAAAHVAQMAG
ncbi:MAG: hypothetical protein AVDCRST_MAG89-3749, partial [uncultured Gemmatimonadetes bacterium]